MGLEDQIAEIEEEIKKTPYNKASQHHIGKLKAKLAKLRDILVERSSGGGGGSGFGVKKTGDAMVVLVGYPSVGKSTLLNKLTNAESETAAYEFTTLDAIPGMMEYKNLNIQLVDLPGLIEGAAEGRGRGREVLSVARSADLVVMLLDVKRLHALDSIRSELYKCGLRLNEKPPKVSIKKKDRGGVHVTSTVRQRELTEDAIKGVMDVYNFHNAEIVLSEQLSEDRFIDVLRGNRIYVPAIIVVNKIDQLGEGECVNLRDDYIPISAEDEVGFEALREEIYKKLDLIRVFLKPQGKEADLDEPLILKGGSTIRDLCRSLHKDFEKKFRYALVWGEHVKHQGQRVGLRHVLTLSLIHI